MHYYLREWPELKVMIKRRRALFVLIHDAFSGVSRHEGVSLHELGVIDGYGGKEVHLKARALDTESCWEEVPDNDIRQHAQEWPFFEPIGFRYYLPAFMRFELRHFYRDRQSMINANVSSMLQSNNQDMFTLLDEAQCSCALTYLEFARDYFSDYHEAAIAIERYWSRRGFGNHV